MCLSKKTCYRSWNFHYFNCSWNTCTCIQSSLPDRERDPLERAQWNLGFLTKGENSVCSTRRNKWGWRAPHRPLHQCARCPTALARPECAGTPMSSQRTVQRLRIIRKSDKNVSFNINLICCLAFLSIFGKKKTLIGVCMSHTYMYTTSHLNETFSRVLCVN